VPLDANGGMRSEFIDLASSSYRYTGNYVLVIKGSCMIEGAAHGKNTMVVAKTVATQSYTIAAAKDSACLALGVSF
jgi:hypothetical protein